MKIKNRIVYILLIILATSVYLGIMCTIVNSSIGFVKNVYAGIETKMNFSGGQFTEKDGALTVENNHNNNYLGASVKVEAFEYQADIHFLTGNNGFYISGLIFGSQAAGEQLGNERENSFWVVEFAIHGEKNIMLHIYKKVNGQYSVVVPAFKIGDVSSLADIYTVKLSVDAVNRLKISLNNHTVLFSGDRDFVKIRDYQGGYLGVLTCNTSIKFLNYSYKETGKCPAIETSDFVTGDYDLTNGVYTVNKLGYNNVLASNNNLSSFMFSSDISLVEGNDGGFYISALIFGADKSGGELTSPMNNDYYVVEFTLHPPQNLFVHFYRQHNGSYQCIMPHALVYSDAELNHKYHCEVKITPDKDILFFVDGNEIVGNFTQNVDFKKDYVGGYVGLLTCVTKAEFSNPAFTDLKNFNPEFTFMSNLKNWTVADNVGIWEKVNEGYKGTQKEGKSVILAELLAKKLTAFSYIVKVVRVSGKAGMVFGNTGTSSYEFNYDNENLYVSKDGAVLYTHILTAEEKAMSALNLQVDFDGISFVFYVNGIAMHREKAENYNGGKTGFTVENGEAIFNHAYFIKETQPYASAIKVQSVTLDREYAPEIRAYYGSVNYETHLVNVCVEYNELEYSAKIDYKEVASGEFVEIMLMDEGWNSIFVTLIDKQTEKKTRFYINIDREMNPDTIYREELRPHYHFTTKKYYMNDPNGLVYNDHTKEYHMFFQYSPTYKHGYENVQNANTSWGHAVSKDLVNWKELPMALKPNELGLCFSGSGVIDRSNTSNLFDDSVPPGSRMVLLYASVYGEDRSQGDAKISLAYSLDDGQTFRNYEGNPVIKNPGNQYGGGFRDPKVFWYADDSYKNGGIWILLGVGNAHFFVSENLIDWEYCEPLRNSAGEIIDSECPDIFKLHIDGDKEKEKWVFTAAGAYYIMGHFERVNDGSNKITFIAETEKKRIVTPTFELAPGLIIPENYATQSFNNMPDGRVVTMSWLPDLIPIPGKQWQGAQTIPLENKLRTVNGEVILVRYPVTEIDTLRDDKPIFTLNDKKVTENDKDVLNSLNGTCLDLQAEITLDSATIVGFTVRKGNGQQMKIYYDLNQQKVIVDKTELVGPTHLGVIDGRMFAIDGNKIKLRIMLDQSCYDVFGNAGEVSFNGLVLNPIENDGIDFFANGIATINLLKVYNMKEMNRMGVRPSDISEGEDIQSKEGKKGCRGSIGVAMVTLSIIMLVGVTVLVGKKNN